MSDLFQSFNRKPFNVTAARVTPLNIEELAEACGGTIMHDGDKEGNFSRDYIKVRVAFPLNEEQTRARIGDWLVKQGRTFKVYKDKPFRSTFEMLDGSPVPGQGSRRESAPEQKGRSDHNVIQNSPATKPTGPSPANMPKKLAETPSVEITSETVEVPVIPVTEPPLVFEPDEQINEIPEENVQTPKPITLDELNDQVGDTRSAQEIMAEK